LIRSWRYRSTAGAAALVGGVGAAVAYVANHHWFALGDLRLFALWTLPLAVLCALLAGSLRAWARTLAGRVRWLSLAAIGALIGGAWAYMAALLLGGWIAGFGVPVLYCWGFGGALAGIATGWVARREPAAPLSDSRRALLPRLVGLPILAFAGTAALFVGAEYGSVYLWDRAEPEVHLLPAGYEGPVIIILNVPNGAPKEREGKARLFRIPASGVLRTQYGPNDGWNAPAFFYVDRAGHRTPIPGQAACSDSIDEHVRACWMGTRMNSNGTPSPEYVAYTVSRRTHDGEVSARGDQVVDSLLFAKH